MICNLKSIEFGSSAKLIELLLRHDLGDARYRYDHSVILSTPEARVAVDQLRGTSTLDYHPALCDGCTFARFTQRGIEITRSGERTFYYTFPGRTLATWLQDAIDNASTEQDQWGNYINKYRKTYDGDTIWYHRDRVAPFVSWRYHDALSFEGGVERVAVNCRARVERDKADGRQKRLADCLDGLNHLAQGYSNGDVVLVHLSLDDQYHAKQKPTEPTSYYWWIEAAGKQVYNGGVIAHQKRDGYVDDNGNRYPYDQTEYRNYRTFVKDTDIQVTEYRVDSWEYSTHT